MPPSKFDDAKRLRYIRILERFSQSIINYLFKTEAPTKEQYLRKVANNVAYLQRTEKAALYKEEYNALEGLVARMIALAESEESIEEIKSELLYAANQIEKSMNRRRYKKEKHSQEKFADWE
ncbi:MAG: hypothetical protein JXK05_01185 [Campylobacterales bacterium]|nr:hypothetical protein [Campylobacterales bacterium]